ncbi:MAG: fatty acid hydroxylase-like protein [Bacteroidetes bacterium]|nr:fatty acid hydroxylase-like protein [Bacteroidota bacterium]
MEFLLYTLLFIASFLLMEFVAWLTHKYLMHGFLWKMHKDHHVNNKGVLEHNDWFSVLFSIPSFLCIYCGLEYNYPLASVAGFAMAAYGLAYFLVHDIFIHQRIKLFRNADSMYLRAVRRSHRIHHKNTEREHAQSFGFLIVNKKYFQQAASNSLFDKKG